MGMCATIMKYLTLSEGYIRVLDTYANGIVCVLDVVRWSVSLEKYPIDIIFCVVRKQTNKPSPHSR